ncbi:MAG: hypothetical protein H6817_00705 [Phycisphaerales bacterium]|nr:hypothetical protein [Phycisphaerales bacterium]
MNKLTPRRLYAVLRPLFAGLLEPRGFASIGGSGCEFHRKVSEDVVHVVSVHKHSRDPSRVQVRVLPTSPLVDEALREGKPFSILLTRNHSLDRDAPNKWSDSPSQYRVTSETDAAEKFEHYIKPTLEQHVLPVLDQVRTVEQLIPLLIPYANEICRGQLLARIGKTQEAEAAVMPLIERWEDSWPGGRSENDAIKTLDMLRSISPRLAERLERANDAT